LYHNPAARAACRALAVPTGTGRRRFHPQQQIPPPPIGRRLGAPAVRARDVAPPELTKCAGEPTDYLVLLDSLRCDLPPSRSSSQSIYRSLLTLILTFVIVFGISAGMVIPVPNVQLKHWDALAPVDDRCLTQLGGCTVVGPGGEPIYSWLDQGLCDVPDMHTLLENL
jgi:hypothetical protein